MNRDQPWVGYENQDEVAHKKNKTQPRFRKQNWNDGLHHTD